MLVWSCTPPLPVSNYAGVDDAAEGEGHAALAGSRFGDLLSDIAPGLGWGLAVAWSPSGGLSLTRLQATRPLTSDYYHCCDCCEAVQGVTGRACDMCIC